MPVMIDTGKTEWVTVKSLSTFILMDNRTRYNKMRKLLSPLVGQIVRMGDIKRKIMINIGTSDAVVRDTLRFMIDLGMIVERSHLVFEVMKCDIE